MKPKPFWLLNHLTVPVAISSPKHMSRDRHAISIQLVDVFGKEPAGAFKKAQRLIEYSKGMDFGSQMQVFGEIPNFGRPFDANACSPRVLELPRPIAVERSTERQRLRQEADRQRRRCRPGISSSGTCSVLRQGATPELACWVNANSRANRPDAAIAKASPERRAIRTHELTI